MSDNTTKKTMIELHSVNSVNPFYLDIRQIKNVALQDNHTHIIIKSGVQKLIKKVEKFEFFKLTKRTKYEYDNQNQTYTVKESVKEVMELLLRADTDIVDFHS